MKEHCIFSVCYRLGWIGKAKMVGGEYAKNARPGLEVSVENPLTFMKSKMADELCPCHSCA